MADKFNIFDCVIVIISLVDMVMVAFGGGGGGDAFAALRAFRMFRILKIFRTGDLRTLLDSIAFTVVTIKDYAILLALFIYVFALLGSSFFAGKVMFDEDGEVVEKDGSPGRINFQNVYRSCMTVFEVMIGENWNAIMYDHMRTVGVMSCIYFIGLVVLGGIIMLNLFLAILLGNFDRARGLSEKKKIFDTINSLLNEMSYDLREAIGVLFDDAEFTKYIYDKVLTESKKLDDGQGQDENENDEVSSYTQQELEIVFAAMCLGIIEKFLSGELLIGED